ncbi:MAG: hypothetical protein RLZ95_1754 [Bacteroidota bacterium]|jgi:hypothetical protein
MLQIIQVLFIYFLLPIANLFTVKDGNLCNQSNTAFNAGERVRYTIYYNVIGMYVNAGNADFVSQSSIYNGASTYTLTATGNSNSKYDWIFKVRDKYESIVDATTLLPYFFSRQINEGSFHQKETISFNQQAKTVTTSTASGVFNTADCTYDVISAIYAARNINFSGLQINDKINLNFFLDKTLYPSYFKYLGRYQMTTQYGKFNVIKLAPLLVKGNVFNGGEKMVVWVTDDPNHVPVRIETPLVVGSIKVDMVSFENLRYPLTSLIEKTN